MQIGITDAICLFLHKKIATIKGHFRLETMEKCFPDFGPFRKEMDEANKIVSGSRRTRRDRASEYERLRTDYLPRLYDLYVNVEYSEELALARQKKRRAISYVGIGAAIVALVSVLAGWADVITVIGILGSIASIISLLAPDQLHERLRGVWGQQRTAEYPD